MKESIKRFSNNYLNRRGNTMSNKKMDLVLEGLKDSKINEGMSFAKYYGFALIKDLGDVKSGELFYCTDTDKNTVTLAKQKDKSYIIKLPISFAKLVFRDSNMLERGKTYALKIDLPYQPVEYMDFLSDKFIKKFTKKFKGEDWIVFPKGTKFKYNGADMSGDYFDVDGEEVSIVSVEDFGYDLGKEIEGYSDIFKEL